MKPFRSPYCSFSPNAFSRCPKTNQFIRTILEAGPHGIDMKDLSLTVHGPNRLSTTEAYLSWDLPRKGLQAVRLANGRITILMPPGISRQCLLSIVN